jgi:hypothetical protein
VPAEIRVGDFIRVNNRTGQLVRFQADGDTLFLRVKYIGESGAEWYMDLMIRPSTAHLYAVELVRKEELKKEE